MFKFVILLFFAINTWVFSQSAVPEDVESKDNAKSSQLSVLDIYDLDFKREVAIIGSGAAVYGINFIVREFYPPKTSLEYGLGNFNKDDVNGFDRWAMTEYSKGINIASDISLGIVIAAPLFLLWGRDWDQAGVYLIMYAETLLISHSFKELVKGVSHRYRPYSYFDSTPTSLVEDRDSAESFFSGHAAFAFSSASFLSTVYSKLYPDGIGKYFITAAAYSAAATVAVLRVAGGMHFPSDVIIGAVWGGLTGYFIPFFHEKMQWKSKDRKNGKESEKGVDVMIYPSTPTSFYGKVSF